MEGWPDTHASVPLKDHVAGYTGTMVQRMRDDGGAVLMGLTTASEFGGVNVTRTKLHGTTHSPWQHGKTPGGSSGGTAAAVSLGTAGDGGGSIRIPAGFTGMVGLKATIGRIPRGPMAQYGNLTVTIGCISRSVRDTARWFDVTNGFDARDPLSLPRETGWEAGLGTHLAALRGARVAFAPNWGTATVSPVMWELLEEAGVALVADCAMRRVDGIDTPEIRFGMEQAVGKYDSAARAKIERRRVELNEAMARIFDPVDGVDYIITASNPDVAFDADGPLPGVFGGLEAGPGNNGRLTFAANLHGTPAISIPAGAVDEQLLLDLALTAERNRPWPLVAPGSPV